MQRSIKGVLCTLLHQCLDSDPSLTSALAHTVPLSSKKTPSDWSETELRRVLDSILRARAKTTYIMVDGLDEITRSDASAQRLISLLYSFQECSALKLCVSSRPEPIFERSFQQYPHLRLQDLTYDDIVHYLQSNLDEILHSLPQSDDRENRPLRVMNHIACQAQGVFLWVELVTRSIKQGVTNHDTWELLWTRVKEVPSDLEALYESMLQRRGSGGKLYRESAAVFFKLLLANGHSPALDSLLAITLYQQHDLRATLFESDSPSALRGNQELHEAMFSVREQMRAQCGGLLELPA
ncbi:hypothetical protein Micbo1qcDRAFT_167093, partial [Microdochium bolleyi]